MRCLSRNPLQAADVGEGLLVDLFLPDRSGQSRIASVRWTQLAGDVAACNRHAPRANERARKWNTVERPGDMPDLPDCSLLGQLETDLRTQRYGGALDAALRDGLFVPERRGAADARLAVSARFSARADRVAAVGSYVDRLPAARTSAGPHPSAGVIATLSGSYGLSEEAITECLDDVVETTTDVCAAA